ncbi:MAG: acylphosphatase [Desulfurellaceae bacterium]|jgi:acylphosphatase|nr:acylphosphatase [Desulfurellaceae bacterium]
MVCKKLVIKGLVQGVGYRHWLRQLAFEKNIKGYVKNSPNKNVNAVLCGEEKDVEEAIGQCFKGPPSALVKDIDVTDTNCNLKDFSIIF